MHVVRQTFCVRLMTSSENSFPNNFLHTARKQACCDLTIVYIHFSTYNNFNKVTSVQQQNMCVNMPFRCISTLHNVLATVRGLCLPSRQH